MKYSYENLSADIGPRVLVRADILDTYGEPAINHHGLGELFEEGLDLQADKHTLKLYGGDALGFAPEPFTVWRNGFRVPYSNTLHIPTRPSGGSTQRVMNRVIAHGLTLSEKRHQPLPRRFMQTEVATGSSVLCVVGLETNSSVIAGIGAVGLFGPLVFAKDKANDQSFFDSQKVTDLLDVHSDDIVFPKDIR